MFAKYGSLLLLSLTCIVFIIGAVQMEKERVVLESDGWRIIGDLRLPGNGKPAAAVLLLHNWRLDRAAYGRLAGLLAELGVASLRIDLRGHGESTNLGTKTRETASGAWRDAVAAIKYLRSHEGIDADRVGILGASFSCEIAARAGREAGGLRAYVILSAGYFSDESVAGVRSGDAEWWFIAAADDHPRVQQTVRNAAAASEQAELTLLSEGGHALELFSTHPELEGKIDDWFARQLYR